jgi:hypothetical protein
VSLVPKSAAVPPGGWHFIDHSTGVPVRLDGESFADVAERVLKHRLANNVPPGNPAGELAAAICGPFPHFCEEQHAGHTPLVSERAPLSRRVMAWIAVFFRTQADDPGEPQNVADDRAAVCAACPQNKDFSRGGCPSCLDSVKRLSFVWRRDRTTPLDSKLHACDVTGQHNQTAVWAQSTSCPEGRWSR